MGWIRSTAVEASAGLWLTWWPTLSPSVFLAAIHLAVIGIGALALLVNSAAGP